MCRDPGHRLSSCPRWLVGRGRGFASLRLVIALASLAASAAGGAYAMKVYRDGIDAETALAQSETNREVERMAYRARTAQVDTFAQRLQAEQVATAAAARDAERVRHETDRLASRARANAAELDGETVARLAELVGEGVGLLAEGRDYLGGCRAAREALTLQPRDGGRLDQ